MRSHSLLLYTMILTLLLRSISKEGTEKHSGRNQASIFQEYHHGSCHARESGAMGSKVLVTSLCCDFSNTYYPESS